MLRNVSCVLAMLCFCAFLSAPAFARPDQGSLAISCSNCHSRNLAGTPISITGNTTTANPTETPGLGKTDRGTVPVYQAAPGSTVTLQFSFTPVAGGATAGGVASNNGIDFALKGFDQTGVVNGSAPNFTKGANSLGTWTDRARTPDWWYTSPIPTFRYNGSTILMDCNINLGSAIPQDYYEFAIQAAGGNEDWSTTQYFYIQVVPEPVTLGLLALGAGGLLLKRYRRRSA